MGWQPQNSVEINTDENTSGWQPQGSSEINLNEMPQDWRDAVEGRSDRFLMDENIRTPMMMDQEALRARRENNQGGGEEASDPNAIKKTFRPWDGLSIEDAKLRYKELAARTDTDIDDKTGFLTLKREDERDMIIPPPNTESNIPFMSKEDIEWLASSPFAYLFPNQTFGLLAIESRAESEKLKDPDYDPNAPKPATTGMGSKLTGMVSDFGGEMLSFGGDILSWGANKTSEKMELEWPELNLGDYGRSFPEIETDNLGDLLFLEGTLPAVSYFIPLTWTKKAMDAGKLGISSVPTKWKNFYKNFVAETAGTTTLIAGLEPETGGLLVGEDALIKILDGAGKGDEESQAKLANSWNLALDVALTNTVLKTAGLTVVGAYNFIADGLVSPIYTVVAKSEEGLKRQFVNDLLVQMTKDINSVEDVNMVKKEIAKLVEDNKELVLDMAKGNPAKKANVQLDTLNALKFGFGKNLDELENLKAIEKPTNAQLAQIKELEKKQSLLQPAILNLERIVKGLEGGADTQKTSIKQSNFQNEIKSNIQELSDSGSDKTLLGASEAITQGIKKDIGLDDAISSVNTYTGQKIVNDQQLISIAKTNLEVGSKVDGLVNEFNTSPTKVLQGKANAGESIAQQLSGGAEVVTKRKDELYDAVKGGDINVDGLYDVLSEIQSRQNALTKASGEVSQNKPFSKLLQIFDKTTKKVNKKPVPKEREDYINDLKKIITKNKVDFGVLYRDIRPEITNLIIDPNVSTQAKEAFVLLRDFIDKDSLDHLVSTGSPEIANAAKQAKNYYASTFAQYFRQGDELESWYENWTVNARRKKPEGTDLEGQNIRGDAFVQGTWDFLDEITVNPNRSKTLGKVSDILNNEVPSEISNPKDLLLYITNDTLLNLKKEIANIAGIGEISEKTVLNIQDQLSKLGLPLRSAGFIDEADQLDNFIIDLTNARGNANATELLLELASKNALETKKQLNKSVLRNFFKTEEVTNSLNIDVIPTDAPYEVFAKVLNPNNVNQTEQIKKLLELGADDPAIIDALRASYGRYFLDTVFTGRKTNVGTEGVRPGKLNLDSSQYKKLMNTGKEIFKDGSVGVYGPETMQTLEAFGVILKNLEEGRLSGSVGQSGTAPAQQAQQSVGKLVNFIIGPLQRTGARVTALAKGIIERAGPNELIKMLADEVLANPDEFARLTRKNVDWLSQETKYDVYKMFVRAGIYSDDEEKTWDDLYDASQEIWQTGMSAIDLGVDILGSGLDTIQNITSLGTRPQ